MAFNAERFDQQKVTGGAWRDVMGGQFLIARAGNMNYMAAQERNGKRQAATAVERQRALYKSIAEGILLDWRDVTDAGGNQIPYSIDAAIKVMEDNPDLVNAIMLEANNDEDYYREDVAAQAGKPQKRSDTN